MCSSDLASKGVLQMEEVRQQIGEHIPGAFAILAEATGRTGPQLADAMKKGEVGAAELVKFAEELERRFGGQLPTALQSTSAEMGRFTNQLFEAARTIGENGFIDQLTVQIRRMNDALKTDEGRAALQALGDRKSTRLNSSHT